MSIEYIASIAEAEYKMFRIIMTTELPDDYQTWLRVREREGSLLRSPNVEHRSPRLKPR